MVWFMLSIKSSNIQVLHCYNTAKNSIFDAWLCIIFQKYRISPFQERYLFCTDYPSRDLLNLISCLVSSDPFSRNSHKQESLSLSSLEHQKLKYLTTPFCFKKFWRQRVKILRTRRVSVRKGGNWLLQQFSHICLYCATGNYTGRGYILLYSKYALLPLVENSERFLV